MDHDTTWLSLFYGYDDLQQAIAGLGPHGLLGNPTVIQHVVAAALVVLIVLMLAWRTRSAITHAGMGAVIPGPEISVRNMFEVAAEALYGQMRRIIGKDAKRYFPVLYPLTLFVFFSNILGLIPGFTPPTDSWNTTFACGFLVFAYYHYHGVRTQGFAHFAHMANPIGKWWGWSIAWLMLPIELVSHISRPFSLGVRLAANMMADHAVLIGFLGLVPVLVPLPFMALGLLVCMVQTLVFALLSMIYIGLAVADAHHDEAHPNPHA